MFIEGVTGRRVIDWLPLHRQRQLYEDEEEVDQNGNPPVEQLQKVEHEQNDRREPEEYSFTNRDARDFARVPGVVGDFAPHGEHEESTQRYGGEEEAEEKCRYCLVRCCKRAHPKENGNERAHREHRCDDEAEENGAHGGVSSK